MVLADIRPPGKTPYVVVTPVTESTFSTGISPEAIVGTYRGATGSDPAHPPRREDFIPGPRFTTFLQNMVAQHAPDVPEYQAQAAAQRDGWLYIVDGRSHARAPIAAEEDVLGAFNVRAGTIVRDSYRRNPHYALLTADGFLALHETLKAKLLAGLSALNARMR